MEEIEISPEGLEELLTSYRSEKDKRIADLPVPWQTGRIQCIRLRVMGYKYKEISDLLGISFDTTAWGLFCTGFAYAVKCIPGTGIEIINAIGAVFYGPLAATFVLDISPLFRTDCHLYLGNNQNIKLGLISIPGVIRKDIRLDIY